MKKKSGKTLMQKWKNKIGGKLSALDKKKLVLTNIPYALAAFYADRAFFLYRNSPGEDMGNKLLYAMEHADRIFAGFVLSNNWKDLLSRGKFLLKDHIYSLAIMKWIVLNALMRMDSIILETWDTLLLMDI